MRRITWWAAGLFGVSLSALAADFKIATVAPESSQWMQEIRAAAAAIKTGTEGRVVDQHDGGDVAGHERDELCPPDPPTRDQGVVDGVVEGAEQVPTLAERVGQQRVEVLTFGQEQREVVGEEPARGEGHECHAERPGEAERRRCRVVPSPLGEAVHQTFVQASALGLGGEMVGGLVKAQERLTGQRVVREP